MYNKTKNIEIPPESVINVDVRKCKQGYRPLFLLHNDDIIDISTYPELHGEELKSIIEDMVK